MSFIHRPKLKQFNREDIYNLIYCIEERPGLWQKRITHQNSRILLTEIATKLKCTISDIQSEWNKLSRSYFKERARITTAKSKIGVECKSIWEFYGALQFLCKFSNNITENLRIVDNNEKNYEEKDVSALKQHRIKEKSEHVRFVGNDSNNAQIYDAKEIRAQKQHNIKEKPGHLVTIPELVESKERLMAGLDYNMRGTFDTAGSYFGLRTMKVKSEHQLGKISFNPNKIFGDFVTQEIQDLSNEAQFKAKAEIQGILHKYSNINLHINKPTNRHFPRLSKSDLKLRNNDEINYPIFSSCDFQDNRFSPNYEKHIKSISSPNCEKHLKSLSNEMNNQIAHKSSSNNQCSLLSPKLSATSFFSVLS